MLFNTSFNNHKILCLSGVEGMSAPRARLRSPYGWEKVWMFKKLTRGVIIVS